MRELPGKTARRVQGRFESEIAAVRTPRTGGLARIRAADRTRRGESYAEVGDPVTPKEMRCNFGATRAAALLGRLRLHLQTERFLAAQRQDALWGTACLEAAVELGEIVAAMPEERRNELLPQVPAYTLRPVLSQPWPQSPPQQVPAGQRSVQ